MLALGPSANKLSMPFYFLLILLFLLFGRPADFFPFLVPFRLALVFSLVTFVLTIVSKSDTAFSSIISIKESKRYLLFFIIMVVGIPFAYHRYVAFEYIFFKYLSNILFFLLFLTIVQSEKKLKITLFVICISTLFYACMSLLQGIFQEGRFVSGTMYDPNDLAYFFVSLFPLFFLFTRKTEQLTKRIPAIFGIIISIVIILFTGSRGGLIGLIAVILYIMFTKVVIKKMGVKIMFSILFGFVFFLNVDKIDIERFHSISNLSSDYNVTSETGRFGLWQRAFRMTESNPITGVGVNCFGMAVGSQRAAEGEIPRWQVAHNSYIQVLAEIGIPGFFMFFSLIFSCLQNFFRLNKNKITISEPDHYCFIAGILKIGFMGSLICAFFLTQAYSIFFTLYFALSSVLRQLSDLERGELAESGKVISL